MLKKWLHSIYKQASFKDCNYTQPSQDAIVAKEQLIDENVIQQIISDTSIEVLPLLIDSYVQESQTRLAIIEQALQQQDYATLEFEAHTLAGTSLAMGVCALGQLAKSIEQACLCKAHSDAINSARLLKDLAFHSQQALQQLKEQL
ncbi:Hpt domain-containing protein [Vibrio rarus]|uniref:Hpt domain-containing protein n=1 Tax=Vibrio rarus TaxID=413403 RepID=UPI0021C3B217|nr:Hpt domain-containing protein [Vibrio rarus]